MDVTTQARIICTSVKSNIGSLLSLLSVFSVTQTPITATTAG